MDLFCSFNLIFEEYGNWDLEVEVEKGYAKLDGESKYWFWRS